MSGAPVERLPARGHRRAAGVAVLGIVFVVLALLKPWEAPHAPVLDRSPGPSPSLVAIASPLPRPPRPPPAAEATMDVASALFRRHDGWGVRAIVAGDATPEEVWQPAHPPGPGDLGWTRHPGRIVSDPVLLPTRDRPVLALGVTSPADEPPLDIRIWRLDAADRISWMSAGALALPGSATERLYLPPSGPDGARAWQPGSYRMDVLLSRRVVRLTVLLPGLAEPSPPRPDLPPIADVGTLRLAVARIPAGAFATSDVNTLGGVIASLDVSPGPPVGEADAWLDLALADDADEAPRRVVGRVSALGLVLPPGLDLRSARLVRLAPTPGVVARAELLELAPSTDGVRRRAGILRAPSHTGWEDGSYRIDATWRERDGSRGRGSWDVDVYPRRVDPAPPLLDAARRALREPAAWGFVVADRSSVARQRPDRAPLDAGRLGSDCQGGTLVPARLPVLAVRVVGEQPGDVAVTRRFEGGLDRRIAVTVATGLPGVVLVAPRTGERWEPGHYAIRFRQGERARSLVFCAATSPGVARALRVPPGTSDLAAYRGLRGLEGGRP